MDEAARPTEGRQPSHLYEAGDRGELQGTDNFQQPAETAESGKDYELLLSSQVAHSVEVLHHKIISGTRLLQRDKDCYGPFHNDIFESLGILCCAIVGSCCLSTAGLA